MINLKARYNYIYIYFIGGAINWPVTGITPGLWIEPITNSNYLPTTSESGYKVTPIKSWGKLYTVRSSAMLGTVNHNPLPHFSDSNPVPWYSITILLGFESSIFVRLVGHLVDHHLTISWWPRTSTHLSSGEKIVAWTGGVLKIKIPSHHGLCQYGYESKPCTPGEPQNSW